MIRETIAPKAYVHKTYYEKTVDVAALHAGKPIRRITHTTDIYPAVPPKLKSRGRATETKHVALINKLMRWMGGLKDPVTCEQMEEHMKIRIKHGHRDPTAIACTLRYLLANGYIEVAVRPAKGRKAAYRAIKDAY